MGVGLVGLTGGASAVLAACGPAGGARPSDTPAKQPATVRYLTRPANILPETFTPWIAAWNASYPHITVDVSMSAPSSTPQSDKAKLLALVAAGDPPDVSGPWEGAWSMIDVAQAVEDLVKRDKYDLTRFQQTTFNSAKHDGKVYTLPYAYGGNGLVMAYNRKLFQESGVPEPAADWRSSWTWSDFREALRKTTRKEGETLTQVGLGGYGYFLSTIPTPWGATWLAEDGKTVTTDTPQIAAAYTSYLELVHGDRTTFQSPGLAQDAAKPTFANGKAAVTHVCCGIASRIKPFDDAGLDWAFAPFPRGGSAPAANDMLAVHLALTRGARQREAGWEFMKWSVEEGRAAALEGRIPPMPAVVEKWARTMFQGRTSVRPEVLQSSLNYAALHWIQHHPGLQTVVYPYVDPWWAAVLEQKVSLRDGLLQAKRELQPQLQDFVDKMPKPQS
jgi:multiple sugar transport system substrate-binding protein